MPRRQELEEPAIRGGAIRLWRDAAGVAHAAGREPHDLSRALGYAHARDRGLQLLLTRAVAQGRASELAATDEAFAIDVWLRAMAFAADAPGDVDRLTDDARRGLEAYCAGVNDAFARHGRPWELRLLRFRAEPWTPADCATIVGFMSYFGLAQCQEDMERLLVHAVRGGVDVAKLKALFRPHLDAVDADLVALVRELRWLQPLAQHPLRFLGDLGGLGSAAGGSNAWALAAARSASGRALHCCDPHLQVNRRPPIWYEFVWHGTDAAAPLPADGALGITMPGTPGIVMGRTAQVSFGFTYGFMDLVDFFVEDVRAGRCRRGDGSRELRVRRERLRRRGRDDVTIAFFENDLGTLEVEPSPALQEPAQIQDGRYLLRAFAGRGQAWRSLQALHDVLGARDVVEAQAVLAPAAISANWVLADAGGRVAFQQSGAMPRRREGHSGLCPLPAWDEANHWRGQEPTAALARVTDPSDGVIVSANADPSQPGLPLAVNLPMAPYREQRIAELLAARERHGLDDLQRVQCDLHSRQAEVLMPLLRPHLPDDDLGRRLAAWDLRYDRDSHAAVLFEHVYDELLGEVFGERTFGREPWQWLTRDTGLVKMYFGVFDEALVSGDPIWFAPRTRDDVVREAAARGLARAAAAGGPRPWGEVQRAPFEHLLFQGKLPRVAGFDTPPLPLEGSRGSIVQAGVFRSQGRTVAFAPSWRYLTDLGSGEARTALPGGPSDRRFGRWYSTGLAEWLAQGYHVLRWNTPPPS